MNANVVDVLAAVRIILQDAPGSKRVYSDDELKHWIGVALREVAIWLPNRYVRDYTVVTAGNLQPYASQPFDTLFQVVWPWTGDYADNQVVEWRRLAAIDTTDGTAFDNNVEFVRTQGGDYPQVGDIIRYVYSINSASLPDDALDDNVTIITRGMQYTFALGVAGYAVQSKALTIEDGRQRAFMDKWGYHKLEAYREQFKAFAATSQATTPPMQWSMDKWERNV